MAETPTPLPDPTPSGLSSEHEDSTVGTIQEGGDIEPVDASNTTSTDNNTTTHDTNENAAEDTTQDTSDVTTSSSSSLPTDEQLIDSMREIMKEQEINTITLRILVGLLEDKFGQSLTNKKPFIKENIPIILQQLQEEGEGEADASEDAEVKEDEEEEEEETGAGEEENAEDAKEAQEALNLSGEDVAVQKFLLEQIKYGGGRVTRGRASGRAAPKPVKPKKRKSTDDTEEGGEPQKKKKKGTPRTNRPKNLSPALAEFIGEDTMTRPDVVKRLHEYIKANNLQNPKNKKNILLDDKLQLVFKRKTTDYFKLNALLSKHLTDPGELL